MRISDWSSDVCSSDLWRKPGTPPSCSPSPSPPPEYSPNLSGHPPYQLAQPLAQSRVFELAGRQLAFNPRLVALNIAAARRKVPPHLWPARPDPVVDRKSTRLNSSH